MGRIPRPHPRKTLSAAGQVPYQEACSAALTPPPRFLPGQVPKVLMSHTSAAPSTWLPMQRHPPNDGVSTPFNAVAMMTRRARTTEILVRVLPWLISASPWGVASRSRHPELRSRCPKGRHRWRQCKSSRESQSMRAPRTATLNLQTIVGRSHPRLYRRDGNPSLSRMGKIMVCS